MFSIFSLMLLALSACSAEAAVDCFTQAGDYYTKPADSPHRVSAGTVCKSTDNSTDGPSCNARAEGYVTDRATLNITSDSTTKAFDAVRQKVDKPFNDTLTGHVAGTEFHLNSGDAGYAGFTTEMRCFAGTLGDCIGGDIEAGTAIEACTPTVLNDDFSDDGSGFPSMNGISAFVSTSESDVTSMTTNPAATKPDNATGPTGTSSASTSGQLSLGGVAVGIIAAGTIFALV